MPAEDDYGQRRLLLHHPGASPSAAGASAVPPADRYHAPPACPAGCPAADRLPAGSQERLADRGPGDAAQQPDKPAEVADGRLQQLAHHPADGRYQPAERTQTLGHCYDRHRYAMPERYTPVQNIGSLDRYGTMATASSTLDRYQQASDERAASDRSLERYAPVERYQPKEPQHADKYAERYASAAPRYHAADRYHQAGEQQYQERFNCERYPPIPCPERFAGQERVPYGQVSYMPPPSPAPASDRFVPPPPLSPATTPSPDCYPANPFPSPTAAPPPERFIPPPPLSPSPTEKYSPKPDRFGEKRYGDGRYQQYHGERFQCYGAAERYGGPSPYHHHHHHHQQQQMHHQQSAAATTDRYSSGSTERYLPPNAHTPVERYVPQPQEPYYQQQPYQHAVHAYDRYTPKWSGPGSDPYMRRDLGYHHHYRLPAPYQPAAQHYQRLRYSHVGNAPRAKCCGAVLPDGYHQVSKSSPGSSSSSSSVTSQGKENASPCVYHHGNAEVSAAVAAYHHTHHLHQQQQQALQAQQQAQQQQQEKAVQCASLRPSKPACRHACSSPGVEYVGQSGGRLVCATPPPPRNAVSAGDVHCADQCCLRRTPVPAAQAAAVWRASPHPVAQPAAEEAAPPAAEPPKAAPPAPVVQRAVSLPAPAAADRYHQRPHQESVRRLDYTQSERIPNRERPRFARSTSRKEAIKNFIKKETASFFGVDEETEVDQQLRWLDRRKRLASRRYGPLKDEFQAPSARTLRRPATVSFGRSVSGSGATGAAAYSGDRPDVLPAPSDVPDAPEERWPDATVRRKESVARMTWDGISYVVTTLTKHRPRHRSQTRQWSRSYPPEDSPVEELEDDVFFDRPSTPSSQGQPEAADVPDAAPMDAEPPPRRFSARSAAPGWRRDPVVRREQQRTEIGGSRIWSAMLDSVLDNSDRRQYGMGWVGKMFGRTMRQSITRDEKVKQQLDDLEDYRPLFTYWVTTVQVLVLAISIICYGFGPFGIDLHQRSGQVLVTSLSLQQVEYMEPANFWFGPRAADLIHLGAKFAPCMRVDNKITKQIDKTREKERETACCIRNDDSGCVQSSKADCSKTISTWKKWSAGDSGPGGRISGSVCGLDPKFCDAPASIHPYEWPDDITKWPICRKTNSFTQRRGGGGPPRDKLAAEHMVCEVIGHPCCIGIHGQCRITTREYCDFVRGHFHEEASLCSQVSCLDDVCGMVPFYFPETPDQFYRLWTSLFLHAGLLQLVVTILIQHYLMRDLEKLTGPLRIGIIYLGSGVAGNLASSIFVPYRADVGPSGSQFGLLACLIVEVLNTWPMLRHPHHALCKLLSITFVLFLFGLLPWVDNYSHLFGFVFGFLLSYALLPFVSFGPYDRRKKIVLIWVCLMSAGVLFVCLVLLFYIIPVYDCRACSYFNCLPITADFCASQNINLMREEPVV